MSMIFLLLKKRECLFSSYSFTLKHHITPLKIAKFPSLKIRWQQSIINSELLQNHKSNEELRISLGEGLHSDLSCVEIFYMDINFTLL